MDNVIIVAVKAFIVYNKKALIVQRSMENAIGAGTWELVGGKLEFGENLGDGLKREVCEETQLDVTVEKLLFASSFQTHEYRQVVILDYLCYAKDDKVILSSEHMNYKWVGKKELNEYLNKKLINKLEEHDVFEYVHMDD